MYSREALLSFIDLTSLNDTDDKSVIALLCEKAISPQGHVAAVCVYPQFVKQVAQFFIGKPIKIATVANFPKGTGTINSVRHAIQEAIQNGAQEIDVVFPYEQFLAGEKMAAHQLIVGCKEVCGPKILLKVILETGALQEPKWIEEASRIALLAGADFLKTSTGKIAVGATREAAETMLKVIKELSANSLRPMGLKVSGGVRTVAQAEEYLELAKSVMGQDWVTPDHFRIGASQLIDTLIMH